MSEILIAKAIIIVSIILFTLVGVNLPLIVLDLTLKVISFVSGSTFFNSLISGHFTPEDPMFIAYITVFLLTMILSIAYTINYSVKTIYNKVDLDSIVRGGFRKGDFFKRYKFLIYWIVGFFFVPLMVNLLLIGSSALGSLFGLDILDNAIFNRFENNDISNYLNNILTEINTHDELLDKLKEILDFILTKNGEYNPSDIFSSSEIQQLKDYQIYIKNSINYLENLRDKISYLEININNSTIDISEKLKEIIEVKNSFLNEINKIEVDFLRRMIEKFEYVNSTEKPEQINLNNIEVLEEFNLSLNKLSSILNSGEKIKDRFINISLGNIVNLNSNRKEYRSEKTTLILSQILYGEVILNPFEQISNLSASFVTLWNAILKLISLIFNFFNEIPIIIKTIGLVFTLSTFFNIAINFGKRTFQLLGLIIVSPYFFVSGIQDEGKKLTIWFETVIGKILLIVFVSLSIQIWSILLLSLDLVPNMIDNLYEDSKNNYAYDILKIFIQVLLLISSTYALNEFINFLSNVFNAREMIRVRNRLYGREIKQGVNVAAKSLRYGIERFKIGSDVYNQTGRYKIGSKVNTGIEKTKTSYTNVQVKTKNKIRKSKGDK